MIEIEFEEMVRTHSPRLLATAYRILGNEQDAQDTVQVALISAWKGIASFDGRSSLYTWLHRIVVNACLGFLRSSRSQRESSLEAEGSIQFDGLPAAWSEPGPTLEKRLAMRRAIQRALSQIPEEFRTVLVLRDVEELSSREVAEMLGIPDATVRQRLHRARAAMAELLRPELCDGPDLTCGGRFDLLMDYIDQALPADLQEPVHNHIEGCAVCSPLLQTYRMTVGLPRAILELTAVESADRDWVARVVSAAA